MTTKITKLVSQPVQVIKKTGKELLKPAGAGNVYAIAGGVALSPVISYGYGKLVDYLLAFLPNIPNWLKTVIKVFFPLIPVPIIAKFKVPGGMVINGTLIGMFFTQVGMIIYEAITGKSLPTVKKVASGIDDSVSVGVGTKPWGTFG